MTRRPLPVVFEPIFRPRPWGGRRLAELFDKALPPALPIGESWELADLPEAQSRVRDGPLSGATLRSLVEQWGSDLLGGAPLVGGRFPLLIKFLDAAEHLSVQVHPRPDDPAVMRGALPAKHEAWYVVQADPGAELFAGFRPGVTPAAVAASAGRAELVELLERWPVAAGECYYLPGGLVHALGAGIVVAEVQTPADVTYRLFDWDRVGFDGRPRPLHLPDALRNARYDVSPAQIRQTRTPLRRTPGATTRLMTCPAFAIDHAHLAAGEQRTVRPGELVIWVLLTGSAHLTDGEVELRVAAGDVVLLPAGAPELRVRIAGDCQLLEVRVPGSRT